MLDRNASQRGDDSPAGASPVEVRRSASFASVLVLLTVGLAFSTACQSSSTNVTGPSGTKCAITVPATLPTIGADGGSGTLTVTVAPECVWSATSGAEWLSITSTPNGQGSGNLTFTASGNPSAVVRRGTLIVGERRVELMQSGAACQFTLTPQTASVGAAGGEGSVTLNGVEGCQWSATSQAEWISIVGSQSGTGSSTVRFTAGANDGPARSGLIAIADRTFAVNQGASGSACGIALANSEQLVPASGGTDSVTVTAQGDCAWTAVSQSPWIIVASGAAGRGPGQVSLTIAPNTGVARVGLVTIGGQTYVVTQASGGSSGCTYNLASNGFSVPGAGGTTAVGVTAPAGCAWTASSGISWIVVAAGGVGNGSGSATLAIAANTGAARSGSVIVAGLVFTVDQAAVAPGCSYALSAADHSAAASGGTTTVDVTAGSGCGWTAASQASWITIGSGANGSGSGTVGLSIAANTGGQRTGTVAIAGQTLTVNQAAAATPGCSYALSDTDHSAGATGGTTTVDVSAGAGCGWTAASQASWITISNGANGSGNGTVTLSIAANAGGQRSGAATIAGRTFTVSQAAQPAAPSCTYNLSASEQSVPSTGGPAPVNVSAGNGCAWTASSQASWITIASGASGSGNGTVTLAVALNIGGERSGSVTIAGRTHTITQASGLLPCNYEIDPTDASSSAGGGTLQVAVTAGLTCTWQAQSHASWITVTSGANGLGNGTVRLTVASNGSGQRTGTVTIAGQTFTVTQAPAPAACSYSLNPTTQSVGPLGGDFTVAVTTQAGCAWSATTGDNWIALIGDTTGTGNGTVTYRIGLGLLFSRSGRITISGQNLTVNQAALLLSNAR